MFTVSETAKILRLSRSKTYDLLKRRQIGHFKLDGKIFVSQADIDAYLASRRVEPENIRIRLRDVRI